jgi:hypothetical protein
MAWNRKRATAAAVLAVAALAGPACSSSDPITPRTGVVRLTATSSPAYSGPFQRAQVAIVQMTARPVDAASAGLLPGPLVLIQRGSTLDLRDASETEIGSVVLSSGTYRIESVTLNSLEMSVSLTPGIEAAVCADGELISGRPGGPMTVEFSNPPTITVSPGGTSRVNVLLDGAGLIEMALGLPYNCAFPSSYTRPTGAQVQPFVSVQ